MVRLGIEGLRKVFPPNVVALEDVSFEIESGEFFVILGPSGSGKTTLLRIIAGLERPSAGRVYIGDRLVVDAERGVYIPPGERNVGMVFQNWALYPHMRVFDNIAYPLKIKKLPKGEIARRVREVSEILGISELLNRYPRQLSGGQQQRVALARALVKEPDVLLLDEPFSNLDARIRIVAREFVRSVQRKLGITTILVTHDQGDAFAVADRIMVIDRGRIQQIGKPLELYTNPGNLFVASFIGDPPMNIVKASKIGAVDILRTRIRVQGGVEDVYIGFRPDDAYVSLDQVGSLEGDSIALEGIVDNIEYRGARAYANLSLAGGVTVKALIPTDSEIGIGSKCSVKIRRIYVFAEDRRRIL